jgi:hypothetical protein
MNKRLNERLRQKTANNLKKRVLLESAVYFGSSFR